MSLQQSHILHPHIQSIQATSFNQLQQWQTDVCDTLMQQMNTAALFSEKHSSEFSSSSDAVLPLFQVSCIGSRMVGMRSVYDLTVPGVDSFLAANVVVHNCNHQRSVPKGHEAAVSKLRESIEALHDDQEEMEDWIEEIQQGKKSSKTDKDVRAQREKARGVRRQARMDKLIEEAKTKFLKGKAERAKIRAAGKEVESEDEGENYGVKDKTRSKPTDLSKAEAALTKLKERVISYEAKMALRDENKEVALGTSKINYMDPRITVAWCKLKEVPLELVFNKSLVTKFPWAMEVPADWRF